MEFMLDAVDHAQTFYEQALQWTVLGISALFLVYSYWLYRLARIAQRWEWKCGFCLAAIGCAVIGLWRIAVVMWYYHDYASRLMIPTTAVVSWLAVTLAFWTVVRWVESVSKRITTTKRNVVLMEEVQAEIVEPILRGEPVSPELIAQHRAKSVSFAAGAK
jgi:hypothetical protein